MMDMTDTLLEARLLVDWIGTSLASPTDLPLPEQFAAATIFILAAAPYRICSASRASLFLCAISWN